MRQLSCDVAIIGAGSAGLAARSAATEAGARTILIESGPGGTTCARTGCMPSKLLIAAANAAHAAARIELFGLRPAGPTFVNGPAVLDRLRSERDRFVGSVLKTTRDLTEDEFLHGRARLAGPTSVAVGRSARIEARAIVIATGARSVVPEALAGLGELVLTNESVFELPDLPASLAVIGAGPLGIELALAFSRLGTAVQVFDSGEHVAGLSDPAVGEAALAILRRELPITLGATVRGQRVAGGAEITWTERSGRGGFKVFERVLVAAGRKPNLDDLGLDKVGLAPGPHGVPAFDPATMRCGESAVFLAGDVGGDRPVLHEASDEGRIAGRNAATFPRVEPFPRSVPLNVVYTDPEIARVGPGWAELERETPAIASADFGESGRARVEGRNAGLIRLYAERGSGRMLGGQMIGPEAEHLAHLLAWSVQRGLTADDMLALPFYHPTVEETLRSALRRLCGELRTRPPIRSGSAEYGPGS